jgi:hypothetical protein
VPDWRATSLVGTSYSRRDSLSLLPRDEVALDEKLRKDLYLGGWFLARGEPAHVSADLLADIGNVDVYFFQEVRVLLHPLRQGGVLNYQGLDVVGVLRRVQCDFRRDRVGPLGRDQKRRALDAGEHREKEVQQDVGVGVERLVIEDVLNEQCVREGPQNHDREEGEHERPRAHHVAHLVGGSLAEGEIVARTNPGVLVPMTFPGRFVHVHDFLTGRLDEKGLR